jgi:hypothetical protein
MLNKDFNYFFPWKNNSKRAQLYGRKFRILATGKMNSALVEFENGQMECISKNAIRKVKGVKQQ